MINAWKKAAKDLSIEIEIPFYFNDIEFPLLVKHFGSKIGTVIVNMDDIEAADEKLPKDYYWSGLNPENYSRYDRNQFIDTLEDWGWCGEEKKRPIWYTGKYYRNKK